MPQLIELVDQGIALAGTGDRADLRRRLEQTKDRLLDPSIRVIVVGEFKQGKSKLINALVNAPVCPVDDDIATAVPTSGPVRRAALRVRALATIQQRNDRDRRGRWSAARSPSTSSRTTCRSAANPGNRATARSSAPRCCCPARSSRRTHARRLAGRRRADLRERAGDARGAALGPRRAARLGCLAGVHRARDPVPPPCHAHLAERRVRAHQDGPVPAVAADRADRPRAPRRRSIPTILLFPVSSQLRLAAVEHAGPRAQRRVGVPGARRLSAPRNRRAVPSSSSGGPRRHDLLSTIDHVRLAIDSELSALQNPEKTPEIWRSWRRRRAAPTSSAGAPHAGRPR